MQIENMCFEYQGKMLSISMNFVYLCKLLFELYKFSLRSLYGEFVP